MRYELTDHEWAAIKPMLPNKPHGVPRVNDRHILSGIFWVLRSSARRGLSVLITAGLPIPRQPHSGLAVLRAT
jgi:hypothetical protein